MTDDSLWAQSLVDLSARLRRGDLSPVTLVDLMLDRIARFDGTLKSYQVVEAAGARAAAVDAAAEIAAGHWHGPLHGIPIGFQFVAKPFAEDLLCRAGHAYQGVTGWHERRPDLRIFESTVQGAA